MAAVALQALEVIDQDAVQARLEQSVGECAAGIAQKPLKQSHIDSSFAAHYACGFVLQMVVDAAARRASDGACGLPCVWRDFQAQVAAGKPWNSDTFVRVAAGHTDERTAEFLRAVVNDVSAQPEKLLREGLVQ